MIELILRNYCIAQYRCKGCGAKDSYISTSAIKHSSCCLIGDLCIFDLIGRKMNCDKCPALLNISGSYSCGLMNGRFNKNNIKELKYFGYWKVRSDE